MLMTRWNPFAELAAMERTVDRIFADMFGAPAATQTVDEPAFFRLPVNIEQVEGKYLVTAPLPGFKPEEVEVTYADGLLTISAKHSEEKSTEGNGYVCREIVAGNFYRQIPVGEIDPDSITAQFEDGLLKVSLPAPAQPAPVKIAISSGTGSQDPESGSRKQLAAESA